MNGQCPNNSPTGQTYLRGIQPTNANGEATFTTFPETVNDVVHTSGVYASRGTNPTTNARDGIFADSLASEITTPTGSPSGGYSANFQVGTSL